jgi:hypothetical protein
VAAVSVLLLSLVVATTQLPGPVPREKEPPAQQRMREQQVPMMVRGCIHGKRLLLTDPTFNDNVADLLNADELLLEGSKDLMQQLRREHEGHDDELTGVAIIRPIPDGTSTSTTDVKSKEVGKKGRITMGVSERSGPTASVRLPVRFKVTGVQHLHEGCTRL